MRKRFLSLSLAVLLLLSLCPAAVAAYTEMHFSDAIVTYIKNGEGFRSMPYSDGTGWYIGYGCACNPADNPNGITELEGETLLRGKMQIYADAINSFLKKYDVAVTQGQFDALCGFAYNFGTSWISTSTTLMRYLVEGVETHTDQEIATAFGAWCHVGSTVNESLLKRRIMEAKMFLYGDYSCTADGWNWLILDANGGSNAFSDVALYKAGESYGVLPEVSRAGWYFAGWQTADGTVLTAADTVSGNLRVTALWSTEPAAAAFEESPAAEEPEVTVRFPDVTENAWYYAYVETLAAEGIVHGYDDGLFRPEASVSWGEALKLILLSAGFPAQEAADGAHWADGYRTYAETRGYIAKGTVTDLDRAITRCEVADLCSAALELPAAGGETPFADTYRAGALALYEAGLMVGSIENGQRLFKGAEALRRAEVCTILTRVLDYVAEHFAFTGVTRVPIDFSLRPNSYDTAAFRTDENGRVRYDGGDCEVRYGIDVSFYQGSIDWEKVAADGIDFAIIRCGYRGYGSGDLSEDTQFRANITGARAAGLDVGVYFFSQAITVEEALEEADYTLSLIRDYDITLPVVFDWEQVTVSGARTQSPNWSVVSDCEVAFCDAVAAAGYTPMTYFSKSMAYLKLDMARLQSYANWLAWYHEVPDYVYEYQMWQYSYDGSVAGIAGGVDMDIAFIAKEK